MNIPIIFENEFFLCADKPHGVLSVPSRFEKEDERKVLGRLLEKQLRKTLFPVHRLDFEVGGLILFAKTKDAQALLSKGFENKTIQKKYRAKTSANPVEDYEIGLMVEWISLIHKGKKRAFIANHGKKSITLMEYRGKKDAVHEFWLWPVTGRSHQLRFEMAHHQMPIDGDKLYGSTVELADGLIELKSIELNFEKFPHREKLAAPLFLKNELVE